MSENDNLNMIKSSTAAITEIIKTTADTPEAKEAAKNLGQTAITITKAVNNCLLPIAAMNYGFEKVRIYFANKFADDIAKKTEHIPPENLIEPKASIAAPALQGLAFAHEEQNLKEMYLNLLANSMDSRKESSVHPAFVEIIKQLNSLEAQILHDIFILRKDLPIAQVIFQKQEKYIGPYHVKANHLLYMHEGSNLTFLPDTPVFIDNWVRLGLIEATYDLQLQPESRYNWVKEHPKYIEISKEQAPEGYEIDHLDGILSATDFGRSFAKAVGILPD